MKINLRESLNKIDLATDNKYDLLNTFDSKKLSDNSKKRLAEAIENNSMASVNKILHESEKQLFKVVIQSGATKRNFESALYEDEAEEIVDYYGGRWIDENGFEWNMYVEEDDESTERVYPFEESLNEASAIRVFSRGSEEYFKLDKVASWLTYFSPNNIYYAVEQTYFDYGQDWKWTTIIAYKSESDSWQAINPKQQESILACTTDEELEEVAKDILRKSRLDKGFNESLTEASYGGAYDIEDDMYFTKEEIVEFADNICEDLAKEFGYKYDIADVYMDSPTKLHIELIDNHDVEVDINVRIDMRRIKKPSDLEKIYHNSTLESFKNRFLEEYQYYEFDESLKESIDISDYEELHYPLRDGDKYYQLYRKIENGKGVWAAAELNKYGSDVVGEPFKITYGQARGFEPIEDSSIRKLSKDLGKKLLPKRENLKEQINLPGYAVKYTTGYSGNGANSGKTEWFRTREERDRRAKELKDKNYTEIKTWKMDNFYHTLPKNESLKETLKLDNDQKNRLIKTIIGAEENELKEIVNDVYFFDRALYLKLRHFIKKDSFKDKKDYLIKVLQNSLEESLTEDTPPPWVKVGDRVKIVKNKHWTKAGDEFIGLTGTVEDYNWVGMQKRLSIALDNPFTGKYGYREFLVTHATAAEDEVEIINDLTEDTIKQNGKWVNKGSEGTHGKFRTKKAAGAQRKSMFANGYKGESLKEAIDDEIDLDYETDFDDNEVEEGNHVFADGEEYVWVERIAGPIYLDFDKWAVWSARVFVDPRDFMTIHSDGKNYDFDGDAFKEKAMAAPIVYFVVEEDTGFIDWGPVESRIEAQDFLNGKQEDWDNDEYYGESLEKNLDEWYVHTLHYEDIGDGREYDYEVDHEEVLDYLSEIAIDEEDAPEDTEEYLKWVEDNFDELFNKYKYEIEEHFREDASQEEYDRRHSSYES